MFARRIQRLGVPFGARRGLATLPPCSHTPAEYRGPSPADVLSLRKAHMNPAQFLYYRSPIMLVEGKGQYVWDHAGRRYLDMIGGIVTVGVGHSHPDVVRAGQEQMARFMHSTTLYLHPEVAMFAQELAAKMPADSGLTNVFFVNSGSEATDLAILLARLNAPPGGEQIVALRNGYHGMSGGSMGLTALQTWKYPVMQPGGILHARNPNRYRGEYGYDDPEAGPKYARDVADVIAHSTSGKVAGFIAETIQGVGGTVDLPPGYLAAAYEAVRAAGGLCIADEVQGGFGRTGTHYWSFETQGVTPDIVTMAKSIGNGTPLAAVVTTNRVASRLASKIYFNTYGGNPVSSAIGRAVLRVIDREGLQANCLARGRQLGDGLRRIQRAHPRAVGDVRGMGLMQGIELVKDAKTKEPAPELTADVFEQLKDAGVLVGKGGLFGNCLRIKPPMVVTAADVDFCLASLEEALERHSRK